MSFPLSFVVVLWLLTKTKTTQHNTTPHHTTPHHTTPHNTTPHHTTQHNTTKHHTTSTQHHTTPNNTPQGWPRWEDALLGPYRLLGQNREKRGFAGVVQRIRTHLHSTGKHYSITRTRPPPHPPHPRPRPRTPNPEQNPPTTRHPNSNPNSNTLTLTLMLTPKPNINPNPNPNPNPGTLCCSHMANRGTGEEGSQDYVIPTGIARDIIHIYWLCEIHITHIIIL